MTIGVHDGLPVGYFALTTPMSLLLDFAKVGDFFHSDNFFTQKSVFFMDISYFCNLIHKNIKHKI